MEYFVLINMENYDLVRGLLNYIVEGVRVIPEIDETKSICGMIFTIKKDCEKNWESFYKELVSGYVTFKNVTVCTTDINPRKKHSI